MSTSLRHRNPTLSNDSIDSTSPPHESYHQKYYKKEEEEEEKGRGKSGSFLSVNWNIVGCLAVGALTVRLASSYPAEPSSDEIPLISAVSSYLKGEHFFLENQPPLAKMIIACAVSLLGGSNNDDFLISLIRGFNVIIGALTVSLFYLFMNFLGLPDLPAISASILLIFENATIVQSKMAFVDSLFLFFTLASVTSFYSFRGVREFSKDWWVGLLATGSFMGAMISSKWVGMLTFIGINFHSYKYLWNALGNTKISLKSIYDQLAARFFGFFILPMVIYIISFSVHFGMTKRYSQDAKEMSLEYQQSLIGHKMPATSANVYYGSKVMLRQYRPGGGYLHSHDHAYENGSRQQQVTTWSESSPDNFFVIHHQYGAETDNELLTLERVTAKQVIRFEHIGTGKTLHSHRVDPPLSNKEHQDEVSAYGDFHQKLGDTNDNWMIEIVDDNGDVIDHPTDANIYAQKTKFRIVHQNRGCYLNSVNKKLPSWGLEQNEVTCGRDTKKTNGIWIIEYNFHEKIGENEPKIQLKGATFIKKFIEMNMRMWNRGRKAERHSTNPIEWPLPRRGLLYWQGKSGIEGARQIYLLGNPFTWSMVGITAIGILGSVYLGKILVARFGGDLEMVESFNNMADFDSPIGYLLSFWLFNYLPFIVLGGSVSNYLTSLMFGVGMVAWLADFTTKKYKNARKPVFSGMIVLAGIFFCLYSPLTFALGMSTTWCKRIKLAKSWDFTCE